MFQQMRSLAGQAAGYIEQISNGFPGSQILSGYIFPAFVQNSVIYFIRCDILLKMQFFLGKG